MGTTEDAENAEYGIREPRETALAHEVLTGKIRQTAFEVHNHFGNGFLEKVHENGLAHRPCKNGHTVVQQVTSAVHDEDGTVVGEYCAGLVVDGPIPVEVRAASGLIPERQAQLLDYPKATGLGVGMLVNFGRARLQVRRFAP